MKFSNLIHWSPSSIFEFPQKSILTQMRNDLERPETTYNDLKRITTNKKRPETTHNDLKGPTINKKRPEMTYNEQETT